MRRLTECTVGLALLMGSAGLSSAEALNVSPSAVIQLSRDTDYEQNLKYLASPDTAITPAKVLRWIDSMLGYAPSSKPSNVEFQPILRVHDSQQQILGQIAYKF